MWATKSRLQVITVCTAVCVAAVLGNESKAAVPEKPVAGKQVHFPNGAWSGLPQKGPNGKVRQCVLVAKRPRAGPAGAIDTRLSLTIGRGSGLAFAILDGEMPCEDILDDQAEIVLDRHSFPAVAFTVGSSSLAMHPGDAAGVLSALEKTATLRLRSDGAGIDTGAIALDLPGEALGWLKQCGKLFDIVIDRPTDPNAPDLPAPRRRSPKIASGQPTAAGPAGIEDKQKISGWDASELRGGDGKIAGCFIRQHYATGSHRGARSIGTFLTVSRTKGLTMMLKDTSLNLPQGQPVEATLIIDGKSFVGLSARVLGNDEIGVYPLHGAALALALGNGASLVFKSPVEDMEFPVPSGIVPWLRACGRRWEIGFEPEEAKR
jgi:hypothetical protein